jgi:transcriptional regulator with XRE-family HTH domain
MTTRDTRNMLYQHTTVNTAYAVSAMEPSEVRLYGPQMDIGQHLGRNLKLIRERMKLKQADMAEKMGIDQGWLSKLERGVEGWDALQKIADNLERAGVDPVQLLQPDQVGATGRSPEEDELLLMLRQAHPEVRRGVLTMLRGVLAAAAPRSASGLE